MRSFKVLSQALLLLTFLFFLPTTNAQAQPWADCDTIRVYSISIMPTESQNENHQANFEAGVQNVMDQTGIPIQILGYSIINDPAATQTILAEDHVLEFLGNPNNIPIVALNEAYQYAIEEAQADYVLLKSPVTANGIAAVATLGASPGRAWYAEVNGDPTNNVLYISRNLIHMMGYTGTVDTEPNLFWPLEDITNNPEPWSVHLSASTIAEAEAIYRQTLRPNDLRDCSIDVSTTSIDPSLASLLFLPDEIVVEQHESDLNFQIVNALGQVFKTGTITKTADRIDIAQLPFGVYYLVLTDDSRLKSEVFWKK